MALGEPIGERGGSRDICPTCAYPCHARWDVRHEVNIESVGLGLASDAEDPSSNQ